MRQHLVYHDILELNVFNHRSDQMLRLTASGSYEHAAPPFD